MSMVFILEPLTLQKTERADDWLINKMLRAVSSLLLKIYFNPYSNLLGSEYVFILTCIQSFDPGVLVVLESIFSLNLSLPINYLLEGFKEKALIIQVHVYAGELDKLFVFLPFLLLLDNPVAIAYL